MAENINAIYHESNDVVRRILSQSVTGAEGLIPPPPPSSSPLYNELHPALPSIDIELIEKRISKQLDEYIPYKESIGIKTELANLVLYSNWAKVRKDFPILNNS
jgi:hypothetical protein